MVLQIPGVEILVDLVLEVFVRNKHSVDFEDQHVVEVVNEAPVENAPHPCRQQVKQLAMSKKHRHEDSEISELIFRLSNLREESKVRLTNKLVGLRNEISGLLLEIHDIRKQYGVLGERK